MSKRPSYAWTKEESPSVTDTNVLTCARKYAQYLKSAAYVHARTYRESARERERLPVKLIGSDGLWIDVYPGGPIADLILRLGESFPDRAFPRARRAHDEDAVANLQQFLKLDDLEDKLGIGCESRLLTRLLNDAFEIEVSKPRRIDARKEICEEP